MIRWTGNDNNMSGLDMGKELLRWVILGGRRETDGAGHL
jgi:hypothetical protein